MCILCVVCCLLCVYWNMQWHHFQISIYVCVLKINKNMLMNSKESMKSWLLRVLKTIYLLFILGNTRE